MEIIITALLVILVVAPLLWAVGAYNNLVTIRNHIQESWGQIDVELTRRHDLIPNLISTVKGYAKHENNTFKEVTQARNTAANTPHDGPRKDVARNENMLTEALGKLFAVAEAYPDLKANQNFLHLQQELSNTEDRIAASRRFYNSNVRAMNTKRQLFPVSIIASIFKFHAEEYFEAQEEARIAPQVSF